VVNPNKALWEKGDFTRLAATMRQSGDELVEQLGIRPGMDILDLGCGDGTTALPAAKRGAHVLGVDIAANLVTAGRARAEAAGLNNLRFEEGDACDLRGIADESFDLVLSMFGAMFAPRPFDAAAEMVRVTRRGGRIVMGNWIPGDPTLVAQILKISAAYTPAPPAGFVSPVTWGVEGNVRERFACAGHFAGKRRLPARDLRIPPSGAAVRVSRDVQALLWADDERVRGRREGRPRSRTESRACRIVRMPEPGRARPHRDTGNLSAGDRHEVATQSGTRHPAGYWMDGFPQRGYLPCGRMLMSSG
jgi:SAM-dependent methyltransferase